MLYLTQAGGEAGQEAPGRIELSEIAAAHVERALLAADRDARLHELATATAMDARFAGWVIRAAEHRLRQTINHAEEAVKWLSEALAAEISASLVADEVPTASEIGQRLPALARKLDGYERELSSFRRRLEHEKIEALKELAYGASHEINNPLANIAARAQTLLQDEEDPERRRKLTAIHRQALRAHEMISDLMLFARPPKLKRSPCDLRTVVREIVRQLAEVAQEYESELACEQADEEIELLADEAQLGVAIHALVVNALEAVGSGGHVRVSSRIAHFEGQEWAEVAVRDNGPGISDEVRQHLFDPFFSGREAGRGLGFGLSKCWRIITDHGGQVDVQQPPGGGGEFLLRLPLPD